MPGRRRPVPVWVVVTLGALLTGAGLLWTSTLYDERGKAILDGPTSSVLVALLGLVGTILVLLLQKSRQVQHELAPNSGKSARDVMDRTEALARDALAKAEHAARSARRAADDTSQLREDVQALRADHTGTASDIRGIRRDIGRLADGLAHREKE